MVTQYSQQNDCVRVQNKVYITKIIVHIITNDYKANVVSTFIIGATFRA